MFLKGLGIPLPISAHGSADESDTPPPRALRKESTDGNCSVILAWDCKRPPLRRTCCTVSWGFSSAPIGVLPGLGPTATVAMLLPVTFVLPPVSALIMLAGIYYGSQYGGSTTSILVNLPGEAASVVTTLDGYQMARQGRAGVALTASAIGSFSQGPSRRV